MAGHFDISSGLDTGALRYFLLDFWATGQSNCILVVCWRRARKFGCCFLLLDGHRVLNVRDRV